MRSHYPYRVAVLGGFGFDNLGDDLILRSALAQLRKTLGNVEITLLSSNPYETAARHKGEEVVFSLEALIRQIILRPLSLVSKGHRKYLLPVPGYSFRRLAQSIRDSDIILSIGGGYLNDYSKFLTHFRLGELAFLAMFRRPVVLYAHEVGPLHRFSLRTLARLALKFVAYATVRDDRSAGVLRGLGFPRERVARTADESWAYDPQIQLNMHSRKQQDGLVIAVNLMPAQIVATAIQLTQKEVSRLDDQLLFGVAQSLKSITSNLAQVFFISMSRADTEIGLRLKEMLGEGMPFQILTDLDSQYAALARSQVLVGVRMHTIIMAAQMGTHPIALTLLSKVSETMQELHLRDQSIRGNPFDPEELQGLLGRVIQKLETPRVINRHIRELRERARINALTVKAALNC